MKILIGADLVPTESNCILFQNGDVESLVGSELLALLDNADYKCFNLEVPLTDLLSPIKKFGPCLSAPTSTISGIKKINNCFFTLANNHILDQSEQGLLSTIQLLKENHISFAGAGKSLEEASKPFVYLYNNQKIGIYCCADHEFSITTEEHGGANPFNPTESLKHISELKSKVDYVIVLYHSGKEHYRYPSPELQTRCRSMVQNGADIVICQHSHCIGCEEKFENGTIVYGQGNFLFDHSKNACWKTGLLIEIVINDDVSITYHPIVKKGEKVRLATDKERDEILDAFKLRSEEIKNQHFIHEQYSVLSDETYYFYLADVFAANTRKLSFRIINKLSRGKLLRKYLDKKMNKHAKLGLVNLLNCETHRELLLYKLKKEI